MKKIVLIMAICLVFASLLLTSCGSGSVNVQVIDGEGNVICNETVEIDGKNPTSIEGTNFYGIDCFESALRQAGIEYYVDKNDIDAYAITNVGDIACAEGYSFIYYVNGKDKTGLSAQHDEVEDGDKLVFQYGPNVSPLDKEEK